MNKYYTLSEDQIKELVKMELAITKNAINLAEDVKKVVTKFDGKQLNKRLQTELQKIDDRLSLNTDFNSFDILFSDYENRSITTDRGCYYVNNNSVIIAGTAKRNAYGDSSTTEDNKIIAAAVIASIDKQVEYLTKTVKQIEEQLENIAIYKQQKRQIVDQIKEHNKSITFTIRNYFDLDIKE